MDETTIPVGAAAAYAPRTPWRPLAAFLTTLLVVVLGSALSLAPLLFAQRGGGLSASVILVSVLIGQVAMGLGGWWLAGLRGGSRRDVLALGPMQVSVGKATLAVIAMFVVTLSYQAFRYYVLGHDIFADMLALAPLFQGPLWPLAVAIVSLGAPLAEEILFRGFLLSAFTQRWPRFGFWSGVAISTAMWTLLHWQYGLPGLLLVALMGVMFSLMLRWSGSLRLSIAAHAINNTIASLYLLFFLAR